jgi:GNAT superfamily N-acetyltransferase
VVIFRDARREDVPAIVVLLADDVLGAEREEAAADEAYQAAFEQVQADPRSRLIVAEADGQVAGTLQLSLLPGLSRHGMLRAQIEGVRVAAPHRGRGLGRAMIEWTISQAREHGCGLVQQEWDSAVSGLAARGLLDDQGALTPAGHELRAQVEDQTDRLAAPPWQYLGERRTEDVVRIGKAMTRAVLTAGAFPREGVFAATR